MRVELFLLALGCFVSPLKQGKMGDPRLELGSPEFQLQLFSTSQAFPPPVREECVEISLPARSFLTKMQSRLSY